MTWEYSEDNLIEQTVIGMFFYRCRAALHTGKHSFVNGKIDNSVPFNWDQENIPKILQANGYQTAMIGKIHLDGIPQGFDSSMVLPGQGQYYNPDFLIEGKKYERKGTALRSFRKLVSGESDEWRNAVYYTYYEYPSVHMVKRHYGVANKRYKLMHF